MKYLIFGGSKSGKSEVGENFATKLAKNNKKYYVATMIIYDEEDQNRVNIHVKKRENKNFITLEHKHDIDTIENLNKVDTYLIDSLTSLVLNEMFRFEHVKSKEEILEKLKIDFSNLFDKTNNLIIVSDYIFSDAIIYDEFSEEFKFILGNLCSFITKNVDKVIQVINKNLKYIKGDKDVF